MFYGYINRAFAYLDYWNYYYMVLTHLKPMLYFCTPEIIIKLWISDILVGIEIELWLN